MRRPIVLVAAGLIVLAACSDDGGTPTATPTTRASTTIGPPPEPAQPSTGTAMTVPRSSRAVPRQGEPLRDGRYFGYVRVASETSVAFDVAQFLYGDDAYEWWDDHNTPDDERSNDYVIVNNTTATRPLPVVPGLSVTVMRGDPTAPETMTMARFVEIYASGEDIFVGPDNPYWVEMKDGYVVLIEGQYRP